MFQVFSISYLTTLLQPSQSTTIILPQMINTSDLLNLMLSISSVLITGAIIWIAIYLIATLKSIQKLADNIDSTTNDINTIKNTVKVGVLGVVSTILGHLAGGDKK